MRPLSIKALALLKNNNKNKIKKKTSKKKKTAMPKCFVVVDALFRSHVFKSFRGSLACVAAAETKRCWQKMFFFGR